MLCGPGSGGAPSVRGDPAVDERNAVTTKSAPLDWTELDDRAVDTVRVLAMDAVQKVGNGHPGTAMSLRITTSCATTIACISHLTLIQR